MVVFEDIVEAIAATWNMVPSDGGRRLKRGCKREIGGSPERAIGVLGRDRDKGKSDVALFAEADGRDGALFGIPIDAKVLMHGIPFPPAVRDVFKASFKYGVFGLWGIRKKLRIWGELVVEAVLDGEA